MISKINKRERILNIIFHAEYNLMKGDVIISRGVKEFMRIENLKQKEDKYAIIKLKYNTELYNMEAMNTFSKKDIIFSMIMCASSINLCSVMLAIINNNSIKSKCQ